MAESQDNNFIYCEPGTEDPLFSMAISVPVGVFTALVLYVIGRDLESRSVPPPGAVIEPVLRITTTIATLLGSIAFLYDLSLEFGSLNNCSTPLPVTFSAFAVSRWITFLVHLYFLCRPFLAWTVDWQVQVLLTSVHVALFVQDIVALVRKQELIAFHFLIISSFYCHEVKDALSDLAVRIFQRFGEIVKVVSHLWLMTILLAGCLRAADEWNTNRGVHPTHSGTLIPMNTLWTYMYFTFVTLSTVGYGDKVPSTNAGRGVVVAMIFLFLTWFSIQFSLLSDFYTAGKVVKRKDFFPAKDNNFQHLVISCGSKYQLMSFLEQFAKEKHKNLLVFVDSKSSDDSVINNGFDIATVRSSDPLAVIKFYGFSSTDSLFIHLNHENPVQLDELTVQLVRNIKDAGCMTRLFVHVVNDRRRIQIGRINYWRSNEIDVCISSQLLTSHMLVLSAYARVIPALIASAVQKELLTVRDESVKSIMKFSAAAVTEYSQNGRILLGAINLEDEVLLLPKTLEFEWLRIVLVTGRDEDQPMARKPNLAPLITTPISADVSIVGTVSDCMKSAFSSHVFPSLTKKLPKVYIYESGLVPSHESTYGLVKAKQQLVDGAFVSIFEHRYEACEVQSCVCGTFDNNHFSTALLSVASRNQLLFNFWKQIIEGDHLVAEQVEVDCFYEDLFKTMVEKYHRVPIGVEISEIERMPILNPSSGQQIRKGDHVVCIRL